MKARPRHVAGRPGTVRPSLPSEAGPNEAAATSPFTAWEAWFRRAPARQQADMLALADRQGFLSLHQLPPLKDAPPRSLPPPGAGLLARMLAGELPALPLLPITPTSSLPASAVISAVHSPDLCLWQRRPDQDLARLLVDVIRKAIGAGQRILLLGPTQSTLERVLREMEEEGGPVVVRFVAPGESAANGTLARFSLQAQRQAFRDRLRRGAESVRTDLEQQRGRHRLEADVWPQLEEAHRQITALGRQGDDLSARLAQVADEVHREAGGMPCGDHVFPSGPFAVGLALLHVELGKQEVAFAQRFRELQDRCEALLTAMKYLQHERQPFEPIRRARSQGRWWSTSYWHSFLQESALAQDRLLETRQHEMESETRAVEAEMERTRGELQQVHARFQQEIASLAATEITRRRAELEQQAQVMARRLDLAQGRWQEVMQRLDVEDRPRERTAAALAEARERWSTRQKDKHESAELAVQWSQYLQDSADDLVDELPRLAPVVVGTPQALSHAPDFASAGSDFDLLILDECERFLESDLLTWTGKARRWLLVGAVSSSDPRTCPTRPTAFHKLWHLLHPSAPRPQYAWSLVESRLCCTLRPLQSEDEAFVESERLADFPEIELRILVTPGTRPHLAQVLFPASMPVTDAKAFIYRELQEAAIDRLDRPSCWQESATALSIQWDCPRVPHEQAVDLEPGVREWICPTGSEFSTCRIEFDKESGWPLARAQEWQRRFLGYLDTGRTFDFSRETPRAQE